MEHNKLQRASSSLTTAADGGLLFFIIELFFYVLRVVCNNIIYYSIMTVVESGVLYRLFYSVVCTVSRPVSGLGISYINVAKNYFIGTEKIPARSRKKWSSGFWRLTTSSIRLTLKRRFGTVRRFHCYLL